MNQTRQTRLLGDVRLAANWWQRMRGLLGTPPGAPANACWLEGCHGVHTCGMAYPLDLLFLDGEGRIVRLDWAMAPWRVSAWVPAARTILEVETGRLSRAQVALGDLLELQPAQEIQS